MSTNDYLCVLAALRALYGFGQTANARDLARLIHDVMEAGPDTPGDIIEFEIRANDLAAEYGAAPTFPRQAANLLKF